MHYAEIKTCDIANGPGVRTSLFVSGCTHRCKGCFNEIAWDFNYGRDFTDDTIKEIIDSLAPDYVTGLTLLGGEPFEPISAKYLPFLSRRLSFKNKLQAVHLLIRHSLSPGKLPSPESRFRIFFQLCNA